MENIERSDSGKNDKESMSKSFVALNTIMANLLDSDIYQPNEIRNALKNRKFMLDKYAKMLSTQQE